MSLLKKDLFSRKAIDGAMIFGVNDNLFPEHGSGDQAAFNLVKTRSGAKHVDMKSAIWGNDEFEVKHNEVVGKPEVCVVHWAGAKSSSQVPYMQLIARFDFKFDRWSPTRSRLRWINNALHSYSLNVPVLIE